MTYSRITNRLMADSSIQNLRINLTRLSDLQTKLSSGKNINLPSEDPVGLNRLLGIDESLKKDERFVDNINNAKSELNTTDSLLSSTTDIIQRARELTIQASNQTNGPDELSAIREEVQQLLNQVVQIANTKFGNKHIFGGLRTTLPPYVVNPSPPAPPNEIVYNGTASPGHERNIEIGSGVTITVNYAGVDIFGQNDITGGNQSGLINTLSNLIVDLDATIAAPTTANYDNIRTHIDDLDTDLDTVLSVQTTVGALVNRLDLTENRLQDRKLALSTEYGAIQDVDLASVVSDLNFQEAVFQTSLATTARVLQPSLLNYLM
ncbi:MAG: flagellar hook-associated protein FlgL [Cyanobacteriota bacterium]